MFTNLACDGPTFIRLRTCSLNRPVKVRLTGSRIGRKAVSSRLLRGHQIVSGGRPACGLEAGAVPASQTLLAD